MKNKLVAAFAALGIISTSTGIFFPMIVSSNQLPLSVIIFLGLGLVLVHLYVLSKILDYLFIIRDEPHDTEHTDT